jgi:hypothetical protein
MLNVELLKNILIVSIASGSVMTLLIQKIKEGINIKNSKIMIAISFFINILVGTLFALNFATINVINALWAGLFSFIGADAIYKALEDKIFTSFKNLPKEKDEIIER